jgi:hypothetical protein
VAARHMRLRLLPLYTLHTFICIAFFSFGVYNDSVRRLYFVAYFDRVNGEKLEMIRKKMAIL